MVGRLLDACNEVASKMGSVCVNSRVNLMSGSLLMESKASEPLHPSFSLTTTTGHRVMASPLPAPTSSPAKAPKPKCSPPTAEELCLKTFHACWYLDKDWLVSFVTSAQRAKANGPITWVEFVPKGHTHLVRSTLKLVPVTKSLPLAKIKEVMFTFILEALNAPGTSPGFFNARKAAKLRTRSCKCKVGEKQPVDALPPDSSPPPLSTGKPSGSTPALSAGGGNEGDKVEVPPGPSSEALGTRGEDPITPHAFSFPDPTAPPPKSAEDALAAAITCAKAQAAWLSTASSHVPSPSPSISSVLRKHSSPPPPTSPPPPVGSPVQNAPQDWRAWMEWKCAAYSNRNPGHPVPAVVTPLDLREAASATSDSTPAPPLLPPVSPLPLAPASPLLQTPPRGKKKKLCKPSA